MSSKYRDVTVLLAIKKPSQSERAKLPAPPENSAPTLDTFELGLEERKDVKGTHNLHIDPYIQYGARYNL